MTCNYPAALRSACEEGFLHDVIFLMENGTTVEQFDDPNFITAIKLGRVQIVKYFLDKGKKINSNVIEEIFLGDPGDGDWKGGNSDVLIELCKANMIHNHIKEQLFFRACYTENTNTALYFLENGFEADSCNNIGSKVAASRGNIWMLKMFYTRLNMDAQISVSKTATRLAATKPYIEILEYLFESACHIDHYKELIDILLEFDDIPEVSTLVSVFTRKKRR